MIKPEELRIGNIISVESGNLKVIQIGLEDIVLNAGETKSGIPLYHYYEYSEVSGIPLTEEILVKAWFTSIYERSDSYINYWNKNKDASIDFDPIGRLFFYVIHDDKQGRFTKHIMYVHQLQNIYQALKGEELDIKL